MAKKTPFFPYKPVAMIFIQPCALPFTGPAWYPPCIPNFAYFLIKLKQLLQLPNVLSKTNHPTELFIWLWCFSEDQHCKGKAPALNCTHTATVSSKRSQTSWNFGAALATPVKSCQTRETPLCELLPVKCISWVAAIANVPISSRGTITPTNTVPVAVFPTSQVDIPKPATQSSK